jgi:hypothetical protein
MHDEANFQWAVGSASGRKPRPNHQRALKILRSMTPAQRLAQAFRLTERARRIFRAGLRNRFPHLDEAGLERVYRELMDRCHNRNY